MSKHLQLVATCALGLEGLLDRELEQLELPSRRRMKGAVGFAGDWSDVWRANWRLRTANRVLVELDSWPAADGDALTAGAGRLVAAREREWCGLRSEELFQPHRTLALRATSSASNVRDTRWINLKTKDGLVDAQRALYGRRSSIDKSSPDVSLRVWLHRDRATLLLDTSGEPLDRRGYRGSTVEAPVRENIAAACVLAAEWAGRGPVVDPMCGSGTLLAEAGGIVLGRAAGALRRGWSFQRLPNYDPERFQEIRTETVPAVGTSVALHGVDSSEAAVLASRENLARAALDEHSTIELGEAFEFVPPAEPGLLLVNPPYGERLQADRGQWRRLGDLMKNRYRGWRAVVLAGDLDRGKHVGLRPALRLPVRNGPLDARILVFDLY